MVHDDSVAFAELVLTRAALDEAGVLVAVGRLSRRVVVEHHEHDGVAAQWNSPTIFSPLMSLFRCFTTLAATSCL